MNQKPQQAIGLIQWKACYNIHPGEKRKAIILIKPYDVHLQTLEEKALNVGCVEGMSNIGLFNVEYCLRHPVQVKLTNP